MIDLNKELVRRAGNPYDVAFTLSGPMTTEEIQEVLLSKLGETKMETYNKDQVAMVKGQLAYLKDMIPENLKGDEFVGEYGSGNSVVDIALGAHIIIRQLESQVKELHRAVYMAMVGSCSCGTKSPDHTMHDLRCMYFVLNEALDEGVV
ncbi:hypothetical protein N9937_01055 [bacterium]|nr:hypothetical protein [bacterium]